MEIAALKLADDYDALKSDLARVTAERDHAQGITEKLPNVSVPQPCQMRAELAEASLKVAREQISALRARVAELEKEAMILRGTVEAVTTQRQQAEQRKAELVEALREVDEIVNDANHSAEDRLCAAANRLLNTSAESATPDHIPDAAKMVSATPAKHPDTEIVDWLEVDPQARLAEVRRLIFIDRDTVREAVHAACKQEASK